MFTFFEIAKIQTKLFVCIFLISVTYNVLMTLRTSLCETLIHINYYVHKP